MEKNIEITLTHLEALLAFYAVSDTIEANDFDELPVESQEALLSVRKKLGQHDIKLENRR